MVKMRRLITLMREVEDQLTVCMRCGMCQSVCPLYAETGREADVARGKLALLDGLLQEMFDRPTGVVERLNKCLLCGSCQANCPSGVPVLDIFLKARAILTGFNGLSTPQKVIFRGLLAHPERLDKMTLWSARFQKLLTKPVNDILDTSCARFISPLLGGRHFKRLAEEPFRSTIPSLNTTAERSGRKVAFFVGCLIDKIYPNIAKSLVSVCQHHGVGLFIPESQGCCGIPALSAGDRESFYTLVRYNLDQFSTTSFDYLVTACATCSATIRELWPLLLADAPGSLKSRAAAFAEKTLDISQFLVDYNIVPPGAVSPAGNTRRKVTYHDPCHLKKSLGVGSQPRALLDAGSFELVEMAPPDQCCGMGGSFNLKYYDISSRIGRRKRDAIQHTGCHVVATSCPACMLQISDMLSQAGDDIDIKHVIELYAERLKTHADTVTTD